MDVKEAVKFAFDHIKNLYEGQNIQQLLLEEVERNGAGWRVTLSFSRPDVPNFAGVFPAEYVREYKVLELNSAGELTSMKMWKV